MAKKTLRDIGREQEAVKVGPRTAEALSHLSPAQQVMAREMNQPKSIGTVLGEVIGEFKASPQVEALALQIIHDGPELRLGMKEWRAVQDLVEAGIVAGQNSVRPQAR